MKIIINPQDKMKITKYKTQIKDKKDHWILKTRYCGEVKINKQEYSKLQFEHDKLNYIYLSTPLKNNFGLDMRMADKYRRAINEITINL